MPTTVPDKAIDASPSPIDGDSSTNREAGESSMIRTLLWESSAGMLHCTSTDSVVVGAASTMTGACSLWRDAVASVVLVHAFSIPVLDPAAATVSLLVRVVLTAVSSSERSWVVGGR